MKTDNNVVPPDLKGAVPDVSESVDEFVAQCSPVEKDKLLIYVDARTKARYCECHLRASRLVELGTIDVPLDPDEQPDYRANREIVEDHVAFEKMKEDAKGRRTFSNIVAEFTTAFDSAHPIKIIGGQHRFNAIREALEGGVDELHGLKVYFDLTPDQRLDVQLISNTNIAASTDLFDRMHETLAGPELRAWCQECGLLDQGTDFADKRKRGQAITVRAARTFILNYFTGKDVDAKKFDSTQTTPLICKTGVPDSIWDQLRKKHSSLWKDKGLKEAGREYAGLIEAQRSAFKGKTSVNVDFAEKASNLAIMSAWAYVAGVLSANGARLKRHYALADTTGKNPLNAAALAKGRHKTDPENYRGLGYRTDPKERGRFVELFYLQAEKGNGIATGQIDLAIKKYHAKQAAIEVLEARAAMSDIDEFARLLLEEAKRFYEKANVGNSEESTRAFLHAALMLGFCAFEAHINSVADDFIVRDELNVLERALLSEREVKLDDGEFTIASGLKIYRLTDRIEFIFRRFSGSPIDKSEKWWGDLKAALITRNELTHPKQQTKVSKLAVESALKAIVQSLDALYRAVYKRPYPPGVRGLDSTMSF